MNTQTVTAPPVGSSVLLASTVEPGENFGRFNLPMNTRELVWQLSNGTPCEVPRFWLNAAMQAIEVMRSSGGGVVTAAALDAGFMFKSAEGFLIGCAVGT